MMNTILIAIGLGLIAAIAFLSATTGPLPARLLFSLITPLPILLAGLGWGVRAGVIAALAGGAILLAFQPAAGALFLSTAGLPAAFLSYLTSLSRPVGDDASQAAREWYPAGRLVLWTAVLGAIPAMLWSLTLDAGGADQKAQMLKVLGEAISAAGFKDAATGLPLPPEQIAMLAGYVYSAIPAATAIAWMAALLVTLWLSGRIMRSSGQLLRPWPELSKIEYPAGAALAFAASLALSAFDGMLGIAARALMGTLLIAFMLMGLAVLHDLTRGRDWRAFVLGMIYGALFLMSVIIALPLALLGLSEGFLNFRNRFSPPPNPGGT